MYTLNQICWHTIWFLYFFSFHISFYMLWYRFCWFFVLHINFLFINNNPYLLILKNSFIFICNINFFFNAFYTHSLKVCTVLLILLTSQIYLFVIDYQIYSIFCNPSYIFIAPTYLPRFQTWSNYCQNLGLSVLRPNYCSI